MNEKIKLNTKMNVHILMTNFWLKVAKYSNKLTFFAVSESENHLRKNVSIATEMAKHYLGDFETQLKEVEGKRS